MNKELESLTDTWVLEGLYTPLYGEDYYIAKQNFKDEVGIFVKSEIDKAIKEYKEEFKEWLSTKKITKGAFELNIYDVQRNLFIGDILNELAEE